MQLCLKEFTDIRVGYTLRGKDAAMKTDEAGLPLLRISDLTQRGQIELESPSLIDPSMIKDQFRVREDDILVASRGVRMTAAIVPPDLRAFVGGQLFTVRIRSSHHSPIDPKYLHWFLNLSSTQDLLLSQTKGSYIKNLSITNFKELEVPIPPLSRQNQIVQLAQLAQQEQALLEQIATKRATYTEAALKRAASEYASTQTRNHLQSTQDD
jgi:hypothetical protein